MDKKNPFHIVVQNNTKREKERSGRDSNPSRQGFLDEVTGT